MALLIEITIDGVIRRVSDEFLTLTHFWDAQVASLSSVKYSMSKKTGGYVEPTFGAVTFLPSLFTGSLSYPVSCVIKVSHTADTEANAKTILEGTAHLTSIGREGVTYDLYAADYPTMETDISYSDTLVGVFTTACTTLGLTLDSSHARVVSPDVLYTATGEKVLIDNLSDMASFFSHLFYIESGTLYLVDMLLPTITVPITEFDIFPSQYRGATPISLFKTGLSGAESTVVGSNSYGDEETVTPQCHTTAANSVTALEDIKTLLERTRIEMYFPLDNVYYPGMKITLTDDSLEIPLNVEAFVRSVTWDFDDYKCVVEGDGVFV